MNADPRTRLAELGLDLPKVSPPKGAYIPAVLSGNLLFVSGQVPMQDGEVVETGLVGADIAPERAAQLARQCALAALAAADSIIGIERVRRTVRVTGYVASATDFAGQAAVVDGASQLLGELFGDAGRHARTSVGVPCLPLGAPVEIELLLEVEA